MNNKLQERINEKEANLCIQVTLIIYAVAMNLNKTSKEDYHLLCIQSKVLSRIT